MKLPKASVILSGAQKALGFLGALGPVALIAVAIALCHSAPSSQPTARGFLGTNSQFLPGTSNTLPAPVFSGSWSLTGEQSSTATGTGQTLALSAQISVVRWIGASDVSFSAFSGQRTGAMVLFENGSTSKSAKFSYSDTGPTSIYSPSGVDLVCGPMTRTWIRWSPTAGSAGGAGRWLPVGGGGCYQMPSTSPDGVVTAPRGATVTDATTGVVWQNRSGGTAWDPSLIPSRWGYRVTNEMFDVAPASNVIGGGSLSVSSAGATPGIMAFASGTSAGVDGAVLRHNIGGWVAGGGTFRFRARVKIDTLSDGTNNHIVRVGAGDATTYADQTDGIYYEYDFATYGDHNWRICTAQGGTRTKTTTGIAAVANTWMTLEFTVNAAGTSVSGTIDSVAIPTPITTNIPVTDGGTLASPGYMQVLKQLGSISRTVRIDWWDFWQVLSVARGL